MIETLVRSTTEFTPQVIAVLKRAYADAVRILGSPDCGPDAQMRVARHMVALAKGGETDEARLCALSVRAASTRKRDLPKGASAGKRQALTRGNRPAHAVATLVGEGEPALSEAEMVALRQACGPVGVLGFPPTEVIHTLRSLGYITIVLGGVQITPVGLERLLRERVRCCAVS